MAESWNTRLMRWGFNWFPAYRRTGANIRYIAADMKTVRIRLPLNWKTRNYVGTMFAGSMYGAIDPIYMIMFIKILGPNYIVWDKAADIRFKIPGRSTLYAEFTVADTEIAYIKDTLEHQEKLDRVYLVELVDEHNVVHAYADKTLHFRKKSKT